MSDKPAPGTRAGAPPEERDPSTWPPECFVEIQRVLDASLPRSGQAIRNTFEQPQRQPDAREFVMMWNEARLKAMSTVGPGRQPHSAPVHAEFVNGILRTSIYTDAVRLRDIRQNPNVSFTTWAANGAAAIVYGTASEVPNSLRDTRPGATGKARQTVLLQIKLKRIYAMKASIKA